MIRAKLPLFAIFVSAIFLGTLIPAVSASIAGTSCTKLNSTKTVSNIKFTCIKVGKKLAWNKGMPVIPKVVPAPGTSPTPSKTTDPTPSPIPSIDSTPTSTPAPTSTLNPKYPKVGEFCQYDKYLAYRFSLVPGYTKSGNLTWLTCNGNSEYQVGLDQKVDEVTLTPVIPTATVRASDSKSYDAVSKSSQNFVNDLQIGASKNIVNLQFFVEEAQYGDYLALLKSDLANVLRYYDTIGISKYMTKNIKVFIGNKNSALNSMIQTNCRREGLSIPGGTYASICDDGATGMIVINVAANILGGMIYDQDADISKVTKSREMLLWFRWAVIHEFYHQFQLGIWRSENLGSHDPLPWIVEGSAQAIPFFFLAKDLGTANSYQYLWEVIQLTNLVPPGQGPENGPTGCTNSSKDMAWNTEDSRRQCQYTQGMLIVETFVARYGIEKWVQLVAGQNRSNINQFDSYFTSVTGDKLSDFYTAADDHARNMGYQIK